MSIFNVGRLCVKIAGRDAGRKCVIVDTLDAHYVLVDGDVRRKKVNVNHLEPLAEVLELKAGARSEDVQALFEAQGLAVWKHTAKNVVARALQQRKGKKANAGADTNVDVKKDAAGKKSAKAEPKVKVTKTAKMKE